MKNFRLTFFDHLASKKVYFKYKTNDIAPINALINAFVEYLLK